MNKPEIMTKKHDKKCPLAPRLRFPEFRDAGEWKDISLNEIASPVTDRATNGGNDTVLTLSAEYGVVAQDVYFDKKIAGNDVKRYIKIILDDFVYNDRTTKSYKYGTIKRLSAHKCGIVSPIYKCFRFNTKEIPVFWECYFESGVHTLQLHKIINEGAKEGRFNISIQQFLSTVGYRPDRLEQQRIADCLSSLDERIAAETSKLDRLKDHKKGLLKQLFPAEGETLPQLRFPEFRDAGEWAKIQLSKIATPVSERATAGDVDAILTLSAEHGIVNQGAYFGKKVASDDVMRYIKIKNNDFVYNDRTTKIYKYGTIKRLSRYAYGIVSPIYKCFRFNNEEIPTFWVWYFESGEHDAQLHGIVNEGAKTGRFNISIQKFLSIFVYFPNKSEQQRIADCLSSLDELITAQTQKIDLLKDHKKGLMQQLFPRIDEVLA